MSNKDKIRYYVILLLILVSWQSVTSAPNIAIRIVYLVALIVPAISVSGWVPAVLTCFATCTLYGFAYSFMPTMVYLYAIVAVVCLAIGRCNDSYQTPPFLFILLFLTVAVNFITTGAIEDISYCLITLVCLPYLVSKDDDIEYKLRVSILAYSFVLCFFYVTHYNEFLGKYDISDDMARSSWGDPNYLSMVIGMGTIISIYNVLKWRVINSKSKMFYLSFLVVSFTCLVLLCSRGALIAVALSSLYFLLRADVRKRTKWMAAIFVAGFLAVLYVAGYFDILEYRMETSDGTGSDRSIIWEEKLSAFFSDSSFIQQTFGLGLKGGGYIGSGSRFRGVHNDYIAFLIEYGYCGLILLLSLLLYPVRKVMKNSEQKHYVIGLTLFYSCCFVTLEPLTGGSLPFYFMYFYIMMTALSSHKELLTR